MSLKGQEVVQLSTSEVVMMLRLVDYSFSFYRFEGAIAYRDIDIWIVKACV